MNIIQIYYGHTSLKNWLDEWVQYFLKSTLELGAIFFIRLTHWVSAIVFEIDPWVGQNIFYKIDSMDECNIYWIEPWVGWEYFKSDSDVSTSVVTWP